ncbi:MAG TPA: hypothetical protein VKV32_10840 [Stellaceae bacterium]|nr:hypothetical protein [Stellaceae bacterium]
MKAGVIAVVFAGSFSVAQAATCYKADEIEADQAIRFQAQLMVLSDSCGSPSYTQFEEHNGRTLAAYQQKLIAYFKRVSAHADSAFDKFITALANKTALDAGHQPIASLCSQSADFLNKASAFNKEDFERYVAEQAAAQRGNYPSCKG